MSFIKFENIVKLFTKYWEKFLVTGVSYTLLLAAITVAFGAVIACLLAGMKLSRDRAAALAFHSLHRDHPRHADASAALFLLLCPARAHSGAQ